MHKDSLLKKFGWHPLSFVSQQEGMSFFLKESGFISYQKKDSNHYVLSNPVTDPNNLKPLLHDYCSQYPQSTFLYINEDTAKVLQDKNFHISCIGQEHILDLTQFKLRSNMYSSLKSGLRQAHKNQITVTEFRPTQNIRKPMLRIHEDWLKNQKIQELNFDFF